jgi:hypothetical protein
LYTNHDRKFPVNEHGIIVRTGTKLTIQDNKDKYSISITGGRSDEIKDELHDKLSRFNSFISHFFVRE